MKEYLKKHIINSKGKKVSDRILIIESDDWGSIRIPNKRVQEYLVQQNLINLNDPFSRYDCLESAQDIEYLYEVLSGHKDSLGNNPVITMNMIMANPDFEKIKINKFEKYYFEEFTKTYEKYYPNQNTFYSICKGIENNLIHPQFHAREHLNTLQWLLRLQNQDERFLKAFEVGCFAIEDLQVSNHRANLMASYDYQSVEELEFIKFGIEQGLQMFESIFGFSSKTSIAPCYVWNNSIENKLHECGIKGIQSSYIQQKNSNGRFERIWHKSGEENKCRQKYFVRNVTYEPALNNRVNWVKKAMESIEIAFLWRKPAIVSSHRINYVGSISENNRIKSLEQLDDLLNKIIKKWPDVVFINSEQLLNYYK